MTTTHVAAGSARPGHRTWRAALILFLTILLGGLGLTGANALWAQSGAVTAQVSTGKWIDYSRSGFSMPLTVSVDDAKDVPWYPFRRSIRLSWTTAETLDPGSQKVTYRVHATKIDALEVRGSALPYQGSASAVTFETTTPLSGWPAESLEISVTPVVNGVVGTSTVKVLWLDNKGRTWLTDVK